jgi:flagellar protein FlbD
MIKLTKFSGEEIWVNPDMIKYVEEGGDTIVTLLSGERLLVKEKVSGIHEAFMGYKRAIASGPLSLSNS